MYTCTQHSTAQPQPHLQHVLKVWTLVGRLKHESDLRSLSLRKRALPWPRKEWRLGLYVGVGHATEQHREGKWEGANLQLQGSYKAVTRQVHDQWVSIEETKCEGQNLQIGVSGQSVGY